MARESKVIHILFSPAWGGVGGQGSTVVWHLGSELKLPWIKILSATRSVTLSMGLCLSGLLICKRGILNYMYVIRFL